MTSQTAAPAAPATTPSADPLSLDIQAFVTSAQQWLMTNWLQIAVALAVGAAIVALLHVVRGWGMMLCRRSPGETGWGTIIGRAIARTGNVFIVAAAARMVSGYAAPPELVADTIRILFTVAAVFQSALWAREIILGFIGRRTEGDHQHGEGISSAMGIIRLLVSVAVFAVALVVVLDNLGVNVTGLIAGLGVGGIAIGLAAQGIFADLFAALSIIFDKPFRKGDAVSYDETNGTIEEIGLKSVRVRSLTGEQRIISNRNLLDKEIVNNSQRTYRRQKWTIGVTYQTPPDVCSTIPALLKAIMEANGVAFVRSGFVGFGASSLDFELEFETDGPDYATFYDARSTVGIAILQHFNASGIDIAYPTQTTFTADPDGRMILPYADVQPVRQVSEG